VTSQDSQLSEHQGCVALYGAHPDNMHLGYCNVAWYFQAEKTEYVNNFLQVPDYDKIQLCTILLFYQTRM
jgi:hypothetical protein